MSHILSDAIKRRVLVELRYDGFQRVVEPYVFGAGSNRQHLTRVYQIEGGSVSGERKGWKLLRLDEVKEVSALDRPFAPRPDYKRVDPAISVVLAQV